jgi:MFS family permease
MLGVPATFTGFLVPIREAGVLIPQLLVAAFVRKIALRKYVWLVGAFLSSLSLVGMAYTATEFEGSEAGIMLILMLILFSLARGICSVSAKDVLGKTIAKSRRGRLMGWSASLSGIAVFGIGLMMIFVDLSEQGVSFFTYLLLAGAAIWLIAAVFFFLIKETPGATEGGGNAISVAIEHIQLIKTDKQFMRFVIARSLLLSIAFAPPFYVLLIQANSGNDFSGLGILIIASGLAALVSSPFWGYMSDKSSKHVMMYAVIGSGLLGLFTGIGSYLEWTWLMNSYALAGVFFILNIMHGGARLGRKTYLVDMANSENRASYVAVSNTLIGILMLLGGLVGFIGEIAGTTAVIVLLALLSLLSLLYIRQLDEVS